MVVRTAKRMPRGPCAGLGGVATRIRVCHVRRVAQRRPVRHAAVDRRPAMLFSNAMVDQSVKMQARKEARREELVQSAFTLFMERGFSATRLEDVAVAAGVAKGTVVVYFPTKDVLFREVIKHYLEPHLAKGEELRDRSGSPRERLEELVRFIHALLCDTHVGGIPKLIMAEVGNFPDLARSFHADVCQRSIAAQSELIRQGIVAGQFRPVDPELAARQLMDPIIMQAIWRHSLGRFECQGVCPQRYLDAHLDTFFRGIAAHHS